MALYELSGPNDLPGQSDVQVVYDPEIAKRDFLVWVEMNLFSMKQLFKQHPEIVNGPVKQYFEANGMDFGTLQRLLNA